MSVEDRFRIFSDELVIREEMERQIHRLVTNKGSLYQMKEGEFENLVEAHFNFLKQRNPEGYRKLREEVTAHRELYNWMIRRELVMRGNALWETENFSRVYMDSPDREIMSTAVKRNLSQLLQEIYRVKEEASDAPLEERIGIEVGRLFLYDVGDSPEPYKEVIRLLSIWVEAHAQALAVYEGIQYTLDENELR